MAIQSLSTDYSGRTVDINIMQGVNAPNKSAITLSFGSISNYCTGIQKLIQRYTIALLTSLGSQISFPSFGTSLINTLTSTSNVYNRADLYPVFNTANAQVVESFKAYDRTITPKPDEQLAGATLTDIQSTPDGGVSIAVKLYTYATDPITFIIPLPI
jgi:hypothetical protein